MSKHLLKLRTPSIQAEVKKYERPPADSKYWEIRAIKSKEKQDKINEEKLRAEELFSSIDTDYQIATDMYLSQYLDVKISLKHIRKTLKKMFDFTDYDIDHVEEMVRKLIISGEKSNLKKMMDNLMYETIGKA